MKNTTNKKEKKLSNKKLSSQKKTIVKKVTDEEKILGTTTNIKTIEILDCFNKDVLYEVTNLELSNNPSIINGIYAKNLFGFHSQAEKEKLEAGEQEVIIKNPAKTKELYKIKVLK